MGKILAAVAWPYANGPRHIGHVAGFGVPSDVFSRYMRMAGHDVLMVSGTDEHGTPILVAADEEGVTPRELADRYNRVIVEDLHALGLSYDLFTRTTTRNHYAVVQELFPGVLRQRLLRRADDAGRDLAVHRPHPARPLHRGHLPDLRVRRRPRRPVRQLRQPARPDRPDQPALAGSTARRRSSSRPSTSSSTCRRWPRRSASGSTSARHRTGGRTCSGSRQNLLDDLRPRAITRDIDWGIAGPAGRLADDPTKRLYVWFDAVIGYLSASIEWARRTGDPDAWRQWWQRPGGAVVLLHGQGQHHLPLARSGRPSCSPTTARATRAATPASYGELNLPTEVVSSEFLTMEGTKFSSSQRVVIYVRDLLEPLRRRRACATSSRPPARRTRTPTSPGRSSSAATTTSWSPAGATWSTAPRSRWRQELRARSRRPGELTAEDEALLRHGRGGVRDGRRPDRAATGRRPAIGEAMRVVGEANKYVSDQAPWKLKDDDQRDRLGTVLHVAAQCVDDLQPLLSPFLPFAAERGRPASRRDRRRHADAAASRRSTTSTAAPSYPVITGDYSGVAAWSAYADRGRRARGQADAGLHQARPVDRRRGTRPPGMTPDRTRLVFSLRYSHAAASPHRN